ncbi:hypothetical protein DL769_003419 [Monosporascus sp. CRB-8-3]|nr:hypothetical protein DL769_003419 [Monosporascus sp. CRB-8-3]
MVVLGVSRLEAAIAGDLNCEFYSLRTTGSSSVGTIVDAAPYIVHVRSIVNHLQPAYLDSVQALIGQQPDCRALEALNPLSPPNDPEMRQYQHRQGRPLSTSWGSAVRIIAAIWAITGTGGRVSASSLANWKKEPRGWRQLPPDENLGNLGESRHDFGRRQSLPSC